MSNLPRNLPELLRAAGLDVVEVSGWEGRGRPGSFAPVGSLNHHTGASARGWSRAKELLYAKWMFLTGRSDLPPPLVQIALGRSGTVYIGAAGRANHAGTAKASGSVSAGDGNTLYSGIEWMLSGTEQIPAEMLKAGATLNAVLTADVLGTSVMTISCHYNTSLTGKWDIGDPNGVEFRGVRVLDVPKFRSMVAAERKRLHEQEQEEHGLIGVALVNVPRKVGPRAWAECWRLAAKSPVFMLNESVSGAQRALYASLAAKHDPRIRQFGLRKCNNPIFWRGDRFKFVSGKVHQIHPAATGPLAKKWPGFNAERTINEVVLRKRKDGVEVAVLCSHWVPNGRKVNAIWRAAMRRKSKALLRDLVRKHQKAGRLVVFGGDTNIHGEFAMPRGFTWHQGKTIDKIGSTGEGEAKVFLAPTDHKHGVRATIRY